MSKPLVDADWDKRWVADAITAFRSVISPEGVNPRAQIGTLSDVEIAWFVAAAVFAYISTRSKQAVAEGTDFESAHRTMHNQEVPPWDAGAIETILPKIGQMTLPWTVVMGSWPKGQVVKLCHRIHELVTEAYKGRAKGEPDTLRRKLDSNEAFSRKASAAAGGPLVTSTELSDACKHSWMLYGSHVQCKHCGEVQDVSTEIPF